MSCVTFEPARSRAMEHRSTTATLDQADVGTNDSASSQRVVRLRLPLLCVGVLLAALLTGAAGNADSSPDVKDLAEIVAVVSFVGSMVALCMGMIGDVYRL